MPYLESYARWWKRFENRLWLEWQQWRGNTENNFNLLSHSIKSSLPASERLYGQQFPREVPLLENSWITPRVSDSFCFTKQFTASCLRICVLWSCHITKVSQGYPMTLSSNLTNKNCVLKRWLSNNSVLFPLKGQIWRPTRNSVCKPSYHMERMYMTSWQPYWCFKTMKQRPCWFSKPIL